LRRQLLADLRSNFKVDFDVVLAVVAQPPASRPYKAENMVGGDCTPSSMCRSENRLGTVFLLGMDRIRNGPLLHELMHGYVASMQGRSRSLIPSGNAGHWGFSSVGGQLGGWDAATLSQVSRGTYQAYAPKAKTVEGLSSGNGGFGIGGYADNSHPYAPLELFLMGLAPKSELPSITYATDAAMVDYGTGTFTASSLVTLTPDQIEAKLTPEDRAWMQAAPKNPRGAVVVLTTTGTIAPSELEMLNRDIDQFTKRGEPTLWREPRDWYLYNFWTATGGRSKLSLAGVSALRR